MMMAAVLAASLLLIVCLLWELWICEGAHLGRRFVVWLYDLAAGRYDRIKGFTPAWERRFLGEPVATALGGLPGARLLDVGAGTGRLARALLPIETFHGTLIALDASRRMLGFARRVAPASARRWVRAWAVPLPFAAHTFDMVASLEALEFTPEPRRTLAEMVRVLRPGGWLLVTNRVGWQAPWILGRTFTRAAFPQVLEGLGLHGIETYRWQIDYDLVWAIKTDETVPME
jgi:ubiquinone/menaquinone biosynthesis C-methylase UbiE